MPGARPASAAEAMCRAFPAWNVAFRFRTSSPPIAPPALGPQGEVYLSTLEGYVHALHPDGSYHWSYTVKGRVTGGAVVVGSGAIFVPTARNVYAFRPRGTLLWSFASPVAIASALTTDGRTRTYFASQDGRVFSLSSRGALLGHIPGKVRVTAEPVVLPSGGVALGRQDGTVVVSSKGKIQRFTLEAPVTTVFGCSADVCAIAGNELQALGRTDAPFRTTAARAAQNGEVLAVVTPDEKLRVFRGTSRELLFERALPAAASAAPSVGKNGTVYVPLRNGALVSVSTVGELNGCVPIANSPLGKPVVDPPRRRVLVTANEGVVASVAIE